MFHRVLLVLLLACLGGCTKPELPDTVIRAASAKELSAFRADLGDQFARDQLQAFDTALQELRLDAMNRDVRTPEAREQVMRDAVNGRTVRQAEILGWQARRRRLLAEIALLSDLLNRDRKLEQRTGEGGTPESVLSRLRNEQDIIDRLQRDVTDAEARLSGWGAPVVP